MDLGFSWRYIDCNYIIDTIFCILSTAADAAPPQLITGQLDNNAN